ncbi:integrase [Paenibacillus swuensis]|uniref:Integrase n=1 Tax=Paenibacillus swuensis TaxID=1178515 RepID=A0A172TL24_9BACL|nr:tyrosine recombinase XerS [Paenibacillus swuensis]ANE47755.1 integrase [Paenibacillus swuensis]
MNTIRMKDRLELEQKIPTMPWYVQKFLHHKLPDLSPSTLLEYIRDYDVFFNWMSENELSAGETPELHDLEKLHMESIDAFRAFLATRKDNARVTITRKLSSLRSLFHYLSQIAEDEQFYPLLKRNVMAKVEIRRANKPKETANRLEGKLLQEEEIAEFIHYIHDQYVEDIRNNKQALYAYHLNKIRDTCIISLILHSGLRVSEIVNLSVGDLDMNQKMVNVLRKGSKEDNYKTAVYFRQEAKPYLTEYMDLRNQTYKSPRREQALFLTLPNGATEGKRMTKRAIQEMVIKYAKRFGKPFLRVHMLRHSFATDYYLQNDLYKTQEQLGHASPETTQIYAHLTDKTMSRAIDFRKWEE